jgi:glycosyltransferase involved in cell wall biosynthesis
MKILFLTQVLPYPLDAGPKIRGYHVLCHLTRMNEITLLSFTRSSDSPEAFSHLKSICKRLGTVKMPRSRFLDGKAMVKSLWTGLPFLITRDEVSQMDQMVKKFINEERYDFIHADQLWMAPYALKAQTEAIKCGYHPGIILDQHNAVQLIPGRMAESSGNQFIKVWLKREAGLMAAYERNICEQFDRVVWVTEEDLSVVFPALASSPNNEKNSVIPICIDAAEMVPSGQISKSKDILFIGGMHWPPNADGVTWFGNEVFPLIRLKQPEARFVAVGKQPPPTLTGENIVTTGYVESTDAYWAESRVFVVPLRAGGGMRVKILDAWVKGIPVISTSIGAEGIKYRHGTDILIADTPDEFAQAVNSVLTDDKFAMDLSKAGQETIRKHYDWQSIYPHWDKVYTSLLPNS